MVVYVRDMNGKPLMPTKRLGWVRRALRDGKAVVVERCPFVIRLTYTTTNYTQPITLGVDAGTVHVGLSATSEKEELFSEEIVLRKDITYLISSRKEARRIRRYRLRYRKSRFSNREKEDGWLAPSVRQRIDAHLKAIEDVHCILPITKIVIEVAQFDTQKIRNPDISGEKYQQGEQLGFWNVREYVLARDDYKCQYCKGKSGDKILNVHHIESRKTGGNSPGNLITLCETCHKAYHRGEIYLKVKRTTSLRDAAVMGIMKWRLYNKLKSKYHDVSITFGYITKYNRIRNNIEKSHISDAFIISKNLNAKMLSCYYLVRKTRRHNRHIHKSKIAKGGKKKMDQAPFEVMGFRLFDRVFYDGKIMFVTGRRSSGRFVIRDINYKNQIELSYKKLNLNRCKRNMIQLLIK